MAIDEDNSVYVGGLSYDATEESLRRAFNLYGSVVAVKIINARDVGGKCYGFVTFTNPRSAIDAIADMNGRTIGGRIVRVNEVRTRGGRPNFHHGNFRRDADWDRERDRERDYIFDRDRYRDRNIERSRDRDRERDRDHERGRDSDRARDRAIDRGRDLEDHDPERIRDHDRDWGRDNDVDWDQERESDKTKDPDEVRDKDKEQQARNRPGGDYRSRELSSNSSDDYHEQVKEEWELFIQRREELQKELVRIQEMVEEKEQVVSDLKKKSQKLEDTLADAKKLCSQRHSMLMKLHKCFLQAQDCAECLKSSEQEFQMLVDTTMTEVDATEDANTRNVSIYAKGQV